MARLRKYDSLSNRVPNDEPRNGASYSQNIKLFKFLMLEYGSLVFILDMAESCIEFLTKLLKKHKKLQSFLNLLKYAIPAVVIVSEFIAKIKRFQQIKAGKESVTNETVEKVRGLLGIEHEDVRIDNYPLMLGSEVSQWLLERPKTKSFKILGYHQYDTLQRLSDAYKEDDSTIITIFDVDGAKFAWVIRMFRANDHSINIRITDMYTMVNNVHKINVLKGLIYREFIQHFDIVNNVLLMSNMGLHTFPRQVIVEKPKQFNISKFSSEIRKILKRKKKRGFVFVGKPGTGKSTIIHCLESDITEYPIVYISSNCFSSACAVRDTFDTLRYIQPCIAIIEDLDSCELKDKRQALGEFLEQIDDVDNSLSIIFLATVNDTSLVHYSLINRPGRFDEVIMIKTPQDKEEVYQIMKCRYDKNRKVDPEITGEFLPFEEINLKLLNTIIEKKYTQADVCEIVEKALLLDNTITNEMLEQSLENLEGSKEALRECNFNGNDPFKMEDEPEKCQEAMITEPETSYTTR